MDGLFLLDTPWDMAKRMLKSQKVPYLLTDPHRNNFDRVGHVNSMGIILTGGLLKCGALKILKELLDKGAAAVIASGDKSDVLCTLRDGGIDPDKYPNLKITSVDSEHKRGINALRFFRDRHVEDSNIVSILTPSHRKIIDTIPKLSVKIFFCRPKEVDILSGKSFRKIAKNVDALANDFIAIERCLATLSS